MMKRNLNNRKSFKTRNLNKSEDEEQNRIE